jgi:HSP20 family protein
MSFGTLIRRRPVDFASAAMLDADRAFNELHRQIARRPQVMNTRARAFAPRVRAVENENEYLVSAELPGVEASDLEVLVEDGVLTIKGRKRLAGALPTSAEKVQGEAEANEAEDEAYVTFERRLRFSDEVEEDAVKASYKNGLLEVTLPKPQESTPEVRTIPVQVG